MRRRLLGLAVILLISCVGGLSALSARPGYATTLQSAPFTLWAPWTNGQTWTNNGGNFYGQGDHIGRDWYCVDWNNGSSTAGQPILAAADGTVVEMHPWNGTKTGLDNLGNYVVISHANDAYQTIYAHLERFDANLRGRAVGPGTTIGYAGSTGNSTAPHLHFCLYNGDYRSAKSIAPDPIDGQSPADNGSITSHNVPGTGVCEAPALATPNDGAAVGSRAVTLDWNDVACPGVSGYTLHLTTGSGPEDGILPGGDIAVGPSTKDVTFPSDGTFSWHVAAWVNGQRTAWSSRRIIINTSGPQSCSANDDQVQLFSEANYGGKCRVLDVGDYGDPGRLAPIGNDDTRSVRVGANVHALLYPNAGFDGAPLTLDRDTPDLQNTPIGSGTSSVRVQRRDSAACGMSADQVQLFSEANYGGKCRVLDVGDYGDPGQLAPIGNDDTRSVRVGANVRALLYPNAGFDGAPLTLDSDTSDLQSTPIGSGTSSVRVVRHQATDCPVDQYRAEYYNNPALAGSPTIVGCEAGTLNHMWGDGGPGNGIATDNFSARWSGRFTFNADSYTFIAMADDGIRVWIDGNLLIDGWVDQPPTTYQRVLALDAGEHDVRVEYYEHGGGAVAQFGWVGTAAPVGWAPDQWQQTAALSVDAFNAVSGAHSLRISADVPNDARWIQTVAVKPQTVYQLSGWIRTENVAHTAEAVDAGANLSAYGTWQHCEGVFGTSDWTYTSCTINSEDSSEITVAARLGYWSGTTTGTAWFDELALQELTPDGLGPNLLINPGAE